MPAMNAMKPKSRGPWRLACAVATLSLVGCWNSNAHTHPSQETQTMKSKTALLVLDMQEDFCSPTGKLNALVADEIDRQDLRAKAVQLIEAARKQGIPTVVTPFHVDYSQPFEREPEGIVAAVVQNMAFDKDGPGGRLIPEIAALARHDDVMEVSKPGLSAFAGTDLTERLRAMGVEEVYVAGLLTNFCVESTVRDAFDQGFQVRVVGDATATFDQEQRDHTLDKIVGMLGQVVTVEEFARGASLHSSPAGR